MEKSKKKKIWAYLDGKKLVEVLQERLQIMADIYKKLVKSRKESGLSVLQLAEMSGCAFKSIYIWESGKGNISFDNAEKILNVFGKEIVIQDKTE